MRGPIRTMVNEAIKNLDSEFISQVLELWAKEKDIQLEFIQPSNPQQNAYVKRYNRTVRYSWLMFDSIERSTRLCRQVALVLQ